MAAFFPSDRAALVIAVFLVALGLERARPLRRITQAKAPRILHNLGIAAFSFVALRFTTYPGVLQIAAWTEREQYGLLHYLQLPSILHGIVALLAMDYTLYLWHRFNHRFPFLWRFHQVHHLDLDMDVSTAFRFHFGELILSTVFRAAQVLLFGVGVGALVLFELAVIVAAQFHHANLRWPEALERGFSRLFVGPRIHGIHHSCVAKHTDANFSTIFSFWDRLHSTAVSPAVLLPREIVIGVPYCRDRRETRFFRSLLYPFRRSATQFQK